MLQFDAVVKGFGSVVALDECTFSAQPGRLTGFLGPNGAGKITAMRAAFGLVDLDASAVRWRGAPDSGGRADAMWVRRGRTRSDGKSRLRRTRQPT